MDLINNLNVFLDQVFSIIENQVYEILDKILIIDLNILKLDVVENIIKSKSLIYIANSFILLYVFYFVLTKLVSLYNGNCSENLYLFIIKLVIVSIVINNGYFILENILDLNSILTDTIENSFKEEITFLNLKDKILSIEEILKSSNISLDGILKAVITFSLTSILISLSIRYVYVIFFIILFPITLVLYSSDLTKELSKTLFKNLLSSLLIQNIIKLILVIPITMKSDNELYKIILLGSLYILQNLNNIVKELFTRVSSNYKRSSLYEM